MVYILSFDIGIRNLAYCYSDDDKIIKWNVMDIQGANVNETCEKCIRLLDETFGKDHIDQVLIENQPVQKNPTMKTIQIVVYTYFLYSKLLVVQEKRVGNVNFISANRKNKYADKYNIDIECKTKYQLNKKKAIACTKILVENTEWEEHFNKHKKKDDLADSYLQTLSFINHEPVLPKPSEPLSDEISSSTSSTSHTEILLSNN
jgi:hypothetical protein